MIQLFGSYTSPYVRHCRVALVQQGIEFEFVETDYAASAARSPTRRVPFLSGAETPLTDSSSILRWAREQGGGRFLPGLAAYDRYLMVDTAMDATVNLFLLEREGLTPEAVPYLARQRDRIGSSLVELDRRFADVDPSGDDGLRLACFLSWASFRNRIDPEPHAVLRAVVAAWDADPVFSATHPSLSG
jgi:glutathione S-transferase